MLHSNDSPLFFFFLTQGGSFVKNSVFVFASSNYFIIHSSQIFKNKFDLKLFHLRYPLEKMTDAEFSLQQIDEIRAYQLHSRGLLMNPYRTFYDHYTIERIIHFFEQESPSFVLFEFSLFSDAEKSIVRYLVQEHRIPIIGYIPKHLATDENFNLCLDLGVQKTYSDLFSEDICSWIPVGR